MEKEAEADGGNGQEVTEYTVGEIVQSEFTEKRERRKVINVGCEWTKTQCQFYVLMFEQVQDQLYQYLTKVHTYTWLPAGEPRALLFLCHG